MVWSSSRRVWLRKLRRNDRVALVLMIFALAVIIVLTILRRLLDSIGPDHTGVDHHVTRTLRRCCVGYMESVLVKTLYRDGMHAGHPQP